MVGRFHLADGVCFERTPEGGVRVLLCIGSDPLSADGQLLTETSASGWASVVASMSKRGESAETHEEALKAHQG